MILITTKKAKKQGVSLQLDIRHGFSARGQGDYERMNANQFMETMWQGYRNQLISNGSSPEEATIATNNDIISKVGINIYNKADNALFDATVIWHPTPGYWTDIRTISTGILPTHVTVTARNTT